MRHIYLTPLRAVVMTALFFALWAGAAYVLGSRSVHFTGWSLLYVIGLVWAVYLIERAAQRLEQKRALASVGVSVPEPAVGVAGEVPRSRRAWNPLDPASSPLYGRKNPRLQQSFVVLWGYSVLFVAVYFLIQLLSFGAKELDAYELPAGGGSDSIKASQVQVRKVVRKKFVINPYSSVYLHAPPPIDKIEVKLTEETANLYQVGQGSGNTGDGDGDGSGFGMGTGRGKVRFLRLKHGDRGWDRNFGIGGDRNMLAEYGARTRMKVGEETEYVDAGQIAAFPQKKTPPLIYISGKEGLPLTANDKKALKNYLTERHGMILGDNHGGHGFHHNFKAVMTEITGVEPVPIPRDDAIHQKPSSLPQLPIVVAHGGTVPLGWKMDGRWVVYYHPGALSDAWRDDHAGIKKEVYELCYQLGVNIIFYAHREYNQWLKSQQP